MEDSTSVVDARRAAATAVYLEVGTKRVFACALEWPAVEKGWLPRYAARRIAWHVLDHAWEIEDKSEF